MFLCLPAQPALAAAPYVVDSQLDSPKMLGSGAACQSILVPLHQCTLRAAIDTANTVGIAGPVVQVPSTFVIPLRNAYGALHPQLSMTITSTGPGKATIDGQLQVGILSVDPNTTVTLNDLILQNGIRGAASGGAVLLGGTLVTNNVDFKGNRAGLAGGAVYDIGGTLTLNGGSMSGGSAQSGAAVFVASDGTMTATGTSFSNNTASQGGGAIEDQGRLTLNGVTLAGNQAVFGGAVFAQGTGIGGPAQLGISNSTLRDNFAPGGGGGALVSGSNLILAGSTLSANSSPSSFGGGLLVTGGDAALINDTLAGNSATSGGGIAQLSPTAPVRPPATSADVFKGAMDRLRAALAAAASPQKSTADARGSDVHKSTAPVARKPDAVSLESVTIASNSASIFGGGVANGIGGVFTAHDSILANNTGAAGGPDCTGTVASIGYNLESGTDCAFTGAGDKQNAAAWLGSLAANGGPTETMALLAGSAAIDAGDPGCPPPASDQRGVLRPQGAHCDIGAFELVLPVVALPAPPTTGRPPRSSEEWAALLLLSVLVAIAFGSAARRRSRGADHV